jgi:hypothetical protein
VSGCSRHLLERRDLTVSADGVDTVRVTNEASAGPDRVRTADVVAALCLATDLAMGFPFEHGLHATRIAMRLGERLGIDPQTG